MLKVYQLKKIFCGNENIVIYSTKEDKKEYSGTLQSIPGRLNRHDVTKIALNPSIYLGMSIWIKPLFND